MTDSTTTTIHTGPTGFEILRKRREAKEKMTILMLDAAVEYMHALNLIHHDNLCGAYAAARRAEEYAESALRAIPFEIRGSAYGTTVHGAGVKPEQCALVARRLSNLVMDCVTAATEHADGRAIRSHYDRSRAALNELAAHVPAY